MRPFLPNDADRESAQLSATTYEANLSTEIFILSTAAVATVSAGGWIIPIIVTPLCITIINVLLLFSIPVVIFFLFIIAIITSSKINFICI